MSRHGLRLTRLVLRGGHRRPAATRPYPHQEEPSTTDSELTGYEDCQCFPLPEPVSSSIDNVLDYLWDDEFSSYMACSREERSNHIYNDMCIVRSWIWNYGEPVCSRCPEMKRAYPSKSDSILGKIKARKWWGHFLDKRGCKRITPDAPRCIRASEGSNLKILLQLLQRREVTVSANCRHFFADHAQIGRHSTDINHVDRWRQTSCWPRRPSGTQTISIPLRRFL